MKRNETLKELWEFARKRKLLLLVPILLAILAVGLLFFIASTTPVGPFVYTLF